MRGTMSILESSYRPYQQSWLRSRYGPTLAPAGSCLDRPSAPTWPCQWLGWADCIQQGWNRPLQWFSTIHCLSYWLEVATKRKWQRPSEMRWCVEIYRGLWTYRLGNEWSSVDVKFEGSLHLKFVTDFDTAVLTDFDSSVDFLATSYPEHLILYLVRGIPNKELTNGQLELQFRDCIVWIQ